MSRPSSPADVLSPCSDSPLVRACLRPIHTGEADGLSWLSLARLAHTAFGGREKPYEEETDGEKLCWVAAVRHLANMLESASVQSST